MSRIYFVRLLFLIFLVGILLRLFYWQIIRSDQLTVKAENQHFENVKVNAKRGQIFFSNGSVLASNKVSYLLYGLPKVIDDKDKPVLASTLAKLLGNPDSEDKNEGLKNQLLDMLSKDLFWVPLQKDIDPDLKKRIDDMHLKGIGFEEDNSRFYPEGSSSAHILGFVANDSKGDNTGYFGLEGYYNGELKGISGNIRQEKDILGLPILTGKFFSNGGKNGDDLVLNIDRSVQFFTEESLKKGVEKYGAKAGSAIVLDPKTGNILALAAYPNYDPAKYTLFPKEFYKDTVVGDSYEPGSTFKVLVMSEAIDQDLLKPDTKCDICSGPVEMAGYQIRTWDNKYYPDSTMTDVIIHSDNTGMVFTSKKIGLDKFYQYLSDFGFGSQTNIDLQDESSPDLRPKKDWKEIDLATASFGQGIAVTPIQMLMAVGAIANGGNLMEPHVVKEIIQNGNKFDIQPKVVRKVLKDSTTKTVTQMMVDAVDKGEAKVFKPKGFSIAGKTGTAQIPVAGHYDPNKTNASFIGFAPANDPKFVILVAYNQPSASIFGAETAAPTFFEIAKQLFNYYKIAPTE